MHASKPAPPQFLPVGRRVNPEYGCASRFGAQYVLYRQLKIVSAVVAPWWNDPGHEPAANEMRSLVSKTITITAKAIQGLEFVLYDAQHGTPHPIQHTATRLYRESGGAQVIRNQNRKSPIVEDCKHPCRRIRLEGRCNRSRPALNPKKTSNEHLDNSRMPQPAVVPAGAPDIPRSLCSALRQNLCA